jgi:LPS export ABC transporter protein LptC
MQSLDKITVAFTLLALVGLSLWLDATFDPSNAPRETTTQPKGEDYFIEGMRTSGRDENGIRFLLTAQRQHRNAENEPAILTRPRLTQFDELHGGRETLAEHGEIKADGSVLTLTGNVRIVQEKTTDRPNTVTDTNRLTIRLASKD